jgi:hypothetical protein
MRNRNTSLANMRRFETILRNLRRRDNIRDFIKGIQDTEC